jgi:curved DNA-binding protein CbpA
MSNLYLILEITASATIEEIKAAYRTLAMKYHPDRETGDNEAFLQVKKAYEVLSDPVRREQYDLTGDTEEVKTLNTQATEEIVNLFQAVLRNTSTVNVLREMRKILQDNIADHTNKKEMLRTKRKRLVKIVRSLTCNSSNADVISSILANERKNTWLNYCQLKKGIALLQEMEHILEDYSFAEEPKPAASSHYQSIYTAITGF